MSGHPLLLAFAIGAMLAAGAYLIFSIRIAKRQIAQHGDSFENEDDWGAQ